MAEKKQKLTLAQTLADLRKKTTTSDGLKIGSLSDFDMTVHPFTTGNISIDAITGVGGLPGGRIVELYGPLSSGKTTTAIQCAAALQQQGGKIFFADYEKALDENYCKALGLDVTNEESFIYMQPASFEEGANTFRKLLPHLDMVIVDSVAMMVTESELSADTGKATVADRAKMMYQFLRQITGPCAEHNVLVVFINHLLEMVDASPMGARMKSQGITRKTTPGGRALPFNASMRIEYKQTGNKRTSTIDPLTGEPADVVSQTTVQVTCTKNKVGKPFRTCEVRVRYGKGFSQAFSVLDILTKHKALKKKGAWYSVPPELRPSSAPELEQIQGEEAFVSRLESDLEWLEALRVYAQILVDQHGIDEASPEGRDENGDLDEMFTVDETTGELS